MKILVTGGAGYIGSHVVALLQARGDRVVVVDDLSSGIAERVGGARLERMSLTSDGAHTALAAIMSDERVDAVMHFAARKRVAESVEKPALYYAENVGGLAAVLRAMPAAGVGTIVFSSSAAVYGMSEGEGIAESASTEPINAYGDTKLIGERMVAASARADALRAVSLRYFNVAGAASPLLADRGADNLLPMVLDRLDRGLRPQIFGSDYATADGTCIRDYVHVLDIAEAHVATLDRLVLAQPGHVAYNLGTGRGTSVREMIDAVAQVTGVAIEPELLPRRVGDPAVVVASPARIAREIGWSARLGLGDIVESAVRARTA